MKVSKDSKTEQHRWLARVGDASLSVETAAELLEWVTRRVVALVHNKANGLENPATKLDESVLGAMVDLATQLDEDIEYGRDGKTIVRGLDVLTSLVYGPLLEAFREEKRRIEASEPADGSLRVVAFYKAGYQPDDDELRRIKKFKLTEEPGIAVRQLLQQLFGRSPRTQKATKKALNNVTPSAVDEEKTVVTLDLDVRGTPPTESELLAFFVEHVMGEGDPKVVEAVLSAYAEAADNSLNASAQRFLEHVAEQEDT